MNKKERAIGSLLGLFVGDAFGAQGEFELKKDLRNEFPSGILNMDDRERAVGFPGSITDDSEMAIMLATSLIDRRKFDARDVRRRYIAWLNAFPSDLGTTIMDSLRDGYFNPESQANGALMRIAPIGILGSILGEEQTVIMSDGDCALTHVHTVCRDVNRLWALAIAKAVREGSSKSEVYKYLCTIAPRFTDNKVILSILREASIRPPAICDGDNQGWVLIAFHLAVYTLLNSDTMREGIQSITMLGGDADTNAAIYGMLAGAIYGEQHIPSGWVQDLRSTRCLEDLLSSGESIDMASLAETLAFRLISIHSEEVDNGGTL